jgi:hypothetical protein
MRVAFGKSTFLAGFAALSVLFAAIPFESAEAQGRHHRVGPGRVGPGPVVGGPGVRRGAYVGRRGGYGRGAAIGAGVVGAAILGGALLAAPAYGRPVPVEEDCYTVRERVWDDYRGRWVRVNRTVCD